MNLHSQGSIYGAAAMIHFLDTDEGKEIAKKNLGVIGIKGIAITALGYGKLDRRIKALGTKAQLYYMRNIGDWVSFIAAQGMPTNTNGYWHDNVGYKYPHSYTDNFVKQKYMNKKKKYYKPGNNKNEKMIAEKLNKLWNE